MYVGQRVSGYIRETAFISHTRTQTATVPGGWVIEVGPDSFHLRHSAGPVRAHVSDIVTARLLQGRRPHNVDVWTFESGLFNVRVTVVWAGVMET